MIFKLNTVYDISNDKNIYMVLPLEKITVEIEIAKSVVSNNCFISIKEDGDYSIEGKLCTTYEGIYRSGSKWHLKKLNGEFFFAYTAKEDIGRDFDIEKLGKTLFLFYDDYGDEV